MAEIRVVILQQGISALVAAWTERDPTSPNQAKWKESATLWPQRLLLNQSEPMEVFFCLDKEVLAEGFDAPLLHRVIQQAHRAMWGAKIYLVVDKRWRPTREDPEEAEPYRWAQTLLENKVADILEWSVQPHSNYTEAAYRSHERMDKLVRHPRHRPWKCLFQNPFILTPEEQRLLSPYLISAPSELSDENCLVVLRHANDNYLTDLEQIVPAISANELMIGLIDRLAEPSVELDSFCRKRGHDLVRFHGVAELYYFMQRLNEPSLGVSVIDDDRLLGNEAIPVRVTNPQFKSHNPQLLITHSYLSAEPDSCFAAATDTWELISDLSVDVRVEIYPAIKSVKLAHIVNQLGHVLAWIHIGHGDAQKGLQQSDDEIFKSAKDWINSFAGYNSSLPLVLFSSCFSQPVAQQFAEAGAGVAIGFAQAVNKRVCVELTKRVVDAALKFNGERAAILSAFLEGHDVLKTVDSEAVPLAFWSSH